MPDMSGAGLIERLCRLFPTLPILHLDDLSRPFGDRFPVPTLYKPFGIAALKDAAYCLWLDLWSVCTEGGKAKRPPMRTAIWV
jgi:hypothetical protein